MRFEDFNEEKVYGLCGAHKGLDIPKTQDTPKGQDTQKAQSVSKAQNIPKGQDAKKAQGASKAQDIPGGQGIPKTQDTQREQDAGKTQDIEKERREAIRDTGEVSLHGRIHLLTVIGEIEGHDCLPGNSKTTKYEHVLPKLAEIEDNPRIEGLLILLNTVGGDVEAGLAIAEMIASLSKPTVSLVLGGSHSIGVPIAVSTDYSFIVKTGTMVIHPVRMNGTVIGAPQTYDYFKQMQDRILGFISDHSKASRERLEELMLDTGILTKDLGTILVGGEAVKEGLIDEIGGIGRALAKLYEMIG